MRKTISTPEQAYLQQLLRRYRLQARLRQVDLARKLQCHQSFVSKYECGERRLDLVELRQVCRALGVPLSQLVREFEKCNDPEP